MAETSNSYVCSSGYNFFPNPDDNIMDSIFKQYEKVIVESLITSFGLDFILNDRHGGDVDTIHNVREIGKDKQMNYKNESNLLDYNNRGEYNSQIYHSHKSYISINREISKEKEEGRLIDAYTGERIARNGKSDLDHVISAKEIHDDAGRVLAGLNGTSLANCELNLQATNPHTNRTKKADSMCDFLNKYGDEYSYSEKRNMYKKDEVSRKAYESKLSMEYYTSSKFAKDLTLAAGNVGARMGLRQALGFIFAEIWFAVKEEFTNVNGNFNLGEFFTAIGNGIKRGYENAKENYKELISKVKEGMMAGAFSSLTTTICNIFFTTAKNFVKIIRQTYASVVEAAKILFINPDNLPFGDRIRATAKILSTGASVVLGVIVSEAIGKTYIGALPVIGEIVKTFCGALVTGILSCTLLYFLDRSTIVNKLVSFLNKLDYFSTAVNYYYQQAALFEAYAAELMKIDIDKFREETSMYYSLSLEVEAAKSEEELNANLKRALNTIGVKIPWEGDFNEFMSSKKSILVFE